MRYTILASIAIWGTLIVGGFWLLFDHEFEPGPSAHAPDEWPTESKIPRATAQPTFVIFAHPHCPCTRATIDELARIVADCTGRLSVVVMFIRPPGFETEWTRSDLWTQSKEIPNTVAAEDIDGREAERFHAITSGQAVLYDAAGKLRFCGGITGSRGHEGQNAGRAAVVEIVRGRSAPVIRTPVFGCPLMDASTEQCQEGVCKH